MVFRTSLMFFTLLQFYLIIVIGAEDKKCFPNNLLHAMCGQHEICVSNTHAPTSGICQCIEGYMPSKNNQRECVPKPVPTVPTPASTAPTSSPEHAEMVHHSPVSTGAITAAVLVPLALAVGGLLVLVGRRYHWFERLQLLQGRRYEEVRIGQEEEEDDDDDDPPLA